MKKCSNCEKEKELVDFPKISKNSLRLRAQCKACHAIANKVHRTKNAPRLRSLRLIWDKKNKEYMQQYYKEYAALNREKKNQYYADRRETDLNFYLAYLLRGRLHSALKRQAKGGSAVKALGCTIPQFRAHLESKFEPGMSWENHGKGKGKWTIDHILPLIRFDLSDPEQVNIVCHYTNMQPMWFEDNVRKGAKLDYNLSTSAGQLKKTS